MILEPEAQPQCVDARPLPFERLSAFVDGDLGRWRASRVAKHLTVCPGCRAEIDGLRALKAALAESIRAEQAGEEPARSDSGSWLKISAQLGAAQASDARRSRWQRLPMRARLSFAAAAALLTTASGWGFWRAHTRGPSDDAVLTQAELQFEGADADFEHALDKLQQVAERERPLFAPDERQRYESALRRVDQDVERYRHRTDAFPADEAAQSQLFTAYRNKVRLYEDYLRDGRRTPANGFEFASAHGSTRGGAALIPSTLP